jgi:hypothetical protein
MFASRLHDTSSEVLRSVTMEITVTPCSVVKCMDVTAEPTLSAFPVGYFVLRKEAVLF